MSERLTNHFDYCDFIDCEYRNEELKKKKQCDFFNMTNMDKCHDKKIYEKLREYEDLEEQGLLLKLPCKVGDCVYYISPHNTISLDEGVIYEGDVTIVYAMEEEIYITIKIHTDYGVTELSNITEFGKTVFLTKEEAEEALRKKVD